MDNNFETSEYARALAESKQVLESEKLNKTKPCVYQVLSSVTFPDGTWDLHKTDPQNVAATQEGGCDEAEGA